MVDDDRMVIVTHLPMVAATRADDDLVCRIGFLVVIHDLVVQYKEECNVYDFYFGESNSEGTVSE